MARVPTFIEIGERIRAIREAKDFNQDDLAVVLSVTRPVVSKIENGKKAINSIELRKICDFLNVSIEDLTKPVEEEELVARFRNGSNEGKFIEAVNEIDVIFRDMIAQLDLRRYRNA